jgi:hypothetical protein
MSAISGLITKETRMADHNMPDPGPFAFLLPLVGPVLSPGSAC